MVKAETARRDRFLLDKFLLVGVLDITFFRTNWDMKNNFAKFLLLVSAFFFTIECAASDRWETLRAINWVENPTNHSQAGRYGELGPYQFRSSTWRMHTNRPFSQAVERSAADEVAVKHYEWIKRALERGGVEASPFNIAMAWNCGVEAVLSGRIPSVSYNYATRVNNLVDALKERLEPVVIEEEGPALPSAEFSLDGGDTELRFRVMRDTPRFTLVAS